MTITAMAPTPAPTQQDELVRRYLIGLAAWTEDVIAYHDLVVAVDPDGQYTWGGSR